MANEEQLERWAQALVEASVLGDLVVAERYGITDRTLRNWRRRLRVTPALRQLYESKLSRVRPEFTDLLTTRSPVVALRRCSPDKRAGAVRGPKAMCQFADAAAAEIVAVAALCGLPEVRTAERGHVLPSGRIVSLLVSHLDDTYTACEFLRSASTQNDEPRALGRLLYLFESVRMHYRVPASSVRLRVLADYDAPPLWNRAAANVGVEIGFRNILEAVRGRLTPRSDEEEPEGSSEASGV